MKTIEKAIVSPTPPNHDNVFWVDVSGNSPVLKSAINGSWKALGGASAEKLTNTTYKELKTLRDTGKLIPGNYYRITDYVTVTTQENTQSAGHPFDIIVLATDTNVLSEDAYATQHEGDTYFANSNLAAWKLKYCLDNDSTRFAWMPEIITEESITIQGDVFARDHSNDVEEDGQMYYAWRSSAVPIAIYTTSETPAAGDAFYANMLSGSGSLSQIPDVTVTAYNLPEEDSSGSTGVIYYMKDEWDNECPYDFKNIQFLRDTEWFGGYEDWCSVMFDSVPEQDMYFYTFSYVGRDNTIIDENNYVVMDSSIPVEIPGEGESVPCTGNKILPATTYAIGLDSFIRRVLNNNIFIESFQSVEESGITFSAHNTFGANSVYNTLGGASSGNNFGEYCSSNVFGFECNANIFGNLCSQNCIIYCGSNVFGYDFSNNTFNSCGYSRFGWRFSDNEFSNCSGSTFGNDCYGNTFGGQCKDSIFGNNFRYNNIKGDCKSSIFGNDVSGCKIGNLVNSTIENGVQFVRINEDNTTEDIQNCKVLSGTRGTAYYDTKTITFLTERSYPQFAGLDSNENIVIWNPADSAS